MPVGADGPESLEWSMLGGLALDVGDQDQLGQLNDDPLLDEPFRWKGIPDDVTARVHEVHAHGPLLRGDTRLRVPHRLPTGTCPRRIPRTGGLPSQGSCRYRCRGMLRAESATHPLMDTAMSMLSRSPSLSA